MWLMFLDTLQEHQEMETLVEVTYSCKGQRFDYGFMTVYICKMISLFKKLLLEGLGRVPGSRLNSPRSGICPPNFPKQRVAQIFPQA